MRPCAGRAGRRRSPSRSSPPRGAKRGGELCRGAGRAGEQQDARGVAVEPVHQARAIRRTEAQGVEQPVQVVGDARSALHRHAVRLVQHQQVVVAVDHQALQVARGVGIDLRLRLRPRGPREAAVSAPTGRRRAGSRHRRGGRPRAPGRCGTASGSRPGSGRGSGGGTSGPAGYPPRRRRRCGRAALISPSPLREGVGGRGPGSRRRPLPRTPSRKGRGRFRCNCRTTTGSPAAYRSCRCPARRSAR